MFHRENAGPRCAFTQTRPPRMNAKPRPVPSITQQGEAMSCATPSRASPSMKAVESCRNDTPMPARSNGTRSDWP